MSLHIGTSGWAYPEWKPGFYPADVPRARFLAHYASVLSGCEINATFYRLQRESTMAGWAEQVPEDFRFAVKAHRRLTHGPPDDGYDDFLRVFLESLEPLGERLGAVLVQFPASRRRDDAVLDRLLAPIGRVTPFAAEFRHASWDDPALDTTLSELGGTRCLVDEGTAPPDALPPGPIGYVRLRGSHYDDAIRGAWWTRLRNEAATRTVFAFTKHKDLPAGDPNSGVSMAEWMCARP
ncbi:MAG: DUF72 domain-containing protein [Thermoleophilia bacterium]|nr:DUF72 domain-containing protein [Thermoleophilia bacterium]